MTKRDMVHIINNKDIINANIPVQKCMQWINESFRMKYDCAIPPKISIHPQNDDFFNTMPCLLPQSFARFAVKVVHRIAGQEPSLGSDILLYDSRCGNLLAIIDGDWITNMRTGAVAALSARLFKVSGVNTYSFLGLGNTARAAALCILADNPEKEIKFRLFRYKNQADLFIERFRGFENLSFEIVDDMSSFVSGAKILISCITAADGLICPNDELYQPGMLLIPVHTRGFQNCDLFFDKIYGDDTGHICGFKYFSKFRKFDELSNVLLNNNKGRENNKERILCYNIGLGLHDAVFSSHIYDILCDNPQIGNFDQSKAETKFWI